MNQAITLLTNNWSNMPQLKLSPFYHSVDQNEVEVLTSVQKALIRMEQDSFKTFTDKKQTKLSSECIAFFTTFHRSAAPKYRSVFGAQSLYSSNF
ncbi:hypothetical protein IDM33_10115 [Acinetobacter seifertii]|nr:hypothetical protein [Acinetobacter seifertii]